MRLLSGPMPDITPAQILALLTFVGGQAVAWGVLTQTREQTLVSGGSVVVAAAWKLADAYLRGSRAKAHVPVPPPPPAS